MRKNKITIVGGKQGVGKSYRTLQELRVYCQNGKKRKARNVVIFDVNEEADYKAFKKIPYNPFEENEGKRTKWIRAFAAQPKKEIRRISCLLPKGRIFSIQQKQQACLDLLNCFRNGMILLEDINAYFINMSKTEFTSTLINVRHRGIDVILHLQSLRMVRPVLWQNGALVRMHKQTDSIAAYKDRFPNYPVVRIAQYIVDRQYAEGNIRHFLYVDLEENKIIGTDGKRFFDAAKSFLLENPSELKSIRNLYQLKGESALKKWIELNKTMWA